MHGSTNHVATTDDAGRYQLFGYAKSPQYDLQIFPRDFDPYFRAIVSIPDTLGLSPLEKDIELSSGTIVSGRLTENFSGRPIAGRVEYYPLFPNDYVSKLERVGRPSSAMTIHGDGQFEIPVYPGPGVLAFKANGIDDADYAGVHLGGGASGIVPEHRLPRLRRKIFAHRGRRTSPQPH